MIAHMTDRNEPIKQELNRRYDVQLKAELQERYPTCRIEIIDVHKNNGKDRKGVTIFEPERNIAPTIYIDEFMEKGYPINTICNEIAALYEKYRDSGKLTINLKDFEEVRSRLCFKLVNAEKNREMLNGMPHRFLYDLAVIYYILIDDESMGMATITVNNGLLQIWDVTEEKLHTCAEENTEKLLNITMIPMEMVIIREMQGGFVDMQDYEVIVDGNCTFTLEKGYDTELYILSNADNTFGAATMLYTDVLDKIGRILKADFYILPSSIHELLIIPDHGDLDPLELFKMVCEVNNNNTEVFEEDFLADNVYYYRVKDRCLKSLL